MNVFLQNIDDVFEQYNLYIKKKLNSKADLCLLYKEFKEVNKTITLENEKKKKKKTAYQNFFTMTRKQITEENSAIPFGELSKMISLKWKKLSREEKKKYDGLDLENFSENENSLHLEKYFISDNPSEDESEDMIEFDMNEETTLLDKNEYNQTDDVEDDDDSCDFNFEED
jgi:hypothetical protein